MSDPIKTSYDPKPVPSRAFDWMAWRDLDEGATVGYGATREAAIADLLEWEDLTKQETNQ